MFGFFFILFNSIILYINYFKVTIKTKDLNRGSWSDQYVDTKRGQINMANCRSNDEKSAKYNE